MIFFALAFLTPGIVLRLIVDHGGPGDRGGGNEAQQQKLHVGLTSQTEHDSHSRTSQTKHDSHSRTSYFIGRESNMNGCAFVCD